MANRETNNGYHSRIPQNLEERIETLESGSGSGAGVYNITASEETEYQAVEFGTTTPVTYNTMVATVRSGKPVILFGYDNDVVSPYVAYFSEFEVSTDAITGDKTYCADFLSIDTGYLTTITLSAKNPDDPLILD